MRKVLLVDDDKRCVCLKDYKKKYVYIGLGRWSNP